MARLSKFSLVNRVADSEDYCRLQYPRFHYTLLNVSCGCNTLSLRGNSNQVKLLLPTVPPSHTIPCSSDHGVRFVLDLSERHGAGSVRREGNCGERHEDLAASGSLNFPDFPSGPDYFQTILQLTVMR